MTKTRGYNSEIWNLNCGKCGCEALRLHASVFKLRSQRTPKMRFYVACDHCGETTGWYDTPEEAMAAYRKLARKSRAAHIRHLLAA